MVTSLNTRQQKFADLILDGMPASRAYRAAGYTASADRTAEASGSKR